jgi:hypothetical protein
VIDALPVEDEYVVQSGEFGLLDKATGKFTRTTVVPLKIGQIYGWRLYIKPDGRAVHWTEEFALPGVPKGWYVKGGQPITVGQPDEDSKQQLVLQKGKVCVTEKDATVTNGMIANYWAVAKGDPIGQYQMRVSLEGQLAKTFLFQVKASKIKAKSGR